MQKKTITRTSLIFLITMLIAGCSQMKVTIPLSYGEPQLFNLGIDKTVHLNIFDDLREDKRSVGDYAAHVGTEQNISKFISNSLVLEMASAGYKVKKTSTQEAESARLYNDLFVEGKILVFAGEYLTPKGFTNWLLSNPGQHIFTIELEVSVHFLDKKFSKKYIEHSTVSTKPDDENMPDRINEAMRIALHNITRDIIADIFYLTKEC